MQALERLAATLPLVAERLGVSMDEALRAISRRGEAGRWVREVAEASLGDEALRGYLMRRARPPR